MQHCPNCDHPIDASDINIAEGVSLCSNCHQLSPLSSLRLAKRSLVEIIQNPPDSCFVEPHFDGARVSVSTKSISSALFGLFAAVFWNGIVSVFALSVAGAFHQHLIGPVPDWLPLVTDEGDPMDLGMAVVVLVFLTPFFVVGISLIVSVFVHLFGTMEIILERDRGHVGIGVGMLRWWRSFDPKRVNSIDIGEAGWMSNDAAVPAIQIIADTTIKTGTLLCEGKRDWLLAILKYLLLPSRHFGKLPGIPYLEWLQPGKAT